MTPLVVRAARLVLAVLALAAVGTGLWRAVQGGFDPVNYVSYFTIQTTVIAAVVLILTALKRYGMFLADNGSGWYVSGAPDPRWDDDRLATLRTVPSSAFDVIRMDGLVTP